MLSEISPQASFLPIWLNLHLGSIPDAIDITQIGRGVDGRWPHDTPRPASLTPAPWIGATGLPSDGKSRQSSRCCCSSVTRFSLAPAPVMDANTPKMSRTGRITQRIEGTALL